VDHDSGRLAWAAPGRDRKTLAKFFDALGETRCAAITHVSADAATATMAGSNTVVAFPITGGHISLFDKSVQANGTPWIQGEVDHSGGLTFSAGGKEVTVTNFIVDPGKSLLTAAAGAQVPLLFLDGTNVALQGRGRARAARRHRGQADPAGGGRAEHHLRCEPVSRRTSRSAPCT